jgi:hypothetical protein
MCADDADRDSFGETVRSIARELGESIERLAGQVDVDEAAGYVGVDPDRAREWIETTAGWLGAQLEQLGDDVASRSAGTPSPFRARRPGAAAQEEDPLRGAAPHPLDLPTEEQGRALAALDSGRWSIEPDIDRLVGAGGGQEPREALGLVLELRAHDWIGADGRLTLAGRRALSRWLESAPPR